MKITTVVKSKFQGDLSAEDVRHQLEGLPFPINTEPISDAQLFELVKDVDSVVVVDFYGGNTDSTDADDLEITWWALLEDCALNKYRMKYYED